MDFIKNYIKVSLQVCKAPAFFLAENNIAFLNVADIMGMNLAKVKIR